MILFVREIKNKRVYNAYGIYFHIKDVYQNQNSTVMSKEAQVTFNYWQNTELTLNVYKKNCFHVYKHALILSSIHKYKKIWCMTHNTAGLGNQSIGQCKISKYTDFLTAHI